MGRRNMPVPLYQLPIGWRSMWVIAMFDLPTDTRAARRYAALFRKSLLEDGFIMLQYSVYLRHCVSIENADLHTRRMATRLPPAGDIKFLTVTDKQFGRIRSFIGKKRGPTPLPRPQLELF